MRGNGYQNSFLMSKKIPQDMNIESISGVVNAEA